MNEIYKTKQKELILECIKKQRKQFKIQDIYDSLNGKVGLTTIYRLTDKLVKDGLLNKEIGEDNITYYQYMEKCNCENHFYLKCENCGSIVHVDCDCIKELMNHISLEHNFKTNNEHIIIKGLCHNCEKRVK